ncbi:DNA mismatch repair endonuclease MutL [Methanosphaerula palustris]|uniref:DNA mismatch repair protein MutL n=1 Tax=Methanosphaerula palustris (strain ATCC BAA-1556 / DSM 19958 / E1-9c) TaxID=521011 RepID=B8GGN1_METPE|nr:DNA mismatch repair endonuclease MutL [Methanosphaerula palustris]ACL16286.1 DNA mismatch repair protein MutL [Methanosphaerula palustris E1-9c]
MSDQVIRQLDQATINQIAAGEVIERPASVAKELIENAIDAGADQIRCEVTTENGEITRIRIVDNGRGMSREDAAIACLPHTTSKLRTLDDLSTIHTMGFRGEALASIGAVSAMMLVTRQKESTSGTRVSIRGGAIDEVAEAGSALGTTVTVDDLFYNTPARKKFQKSLKTELGHLYGIVERIALANPGIGFRLLLNRRGRITTQRSSNKRDTIVGLYGPELARGLIPVSASDGPVQIEGFISPPAISRLEPYQVHLSINRRDIYNRALLNAIREGYGTLLPKDRYPVAFLDLTIDTTLVDVNVHPAKRQVRLDQEQTVTAAVTAMIRAALDEADLLYRPITYHPAGQKAEGVGETNALYAGSSGAARTGTPAPSSSPSPRRLQQTTAPRLLTTQQLRLTSRPVSPEEGAPGHSNLPEMRVLGQVANTYLIAETPDQTLCLIDQHAAHERILYDQIRRNRTVQTQELITPVLLTVTLQEAEAIREATPIFEREGFRIEEFGRDSFAVSAVPVIFGRIEDPEQVREIIAGVIGEEPGDQTATRNAITSRVACRGAVKAGAALTNEQGEQLLAQLAATEDPFTCPHGRPTVVRFTLEQLAALFLRT